MPDPRYDSARYLELAAECRRLAELAADDAASTYYRRLIEYYLTLAKAAEKRPVSQTVLERSD
jgi:hypothetical protein